VQPQGHRHNPPPFILSLLQTSPQRLSLHMLCVRLLLPQLGYASSNISCHNIGAYCFVICRQESPTRWVLLVSPQLCTEACGACTNLFCQLTAVATQARQRMSSLLVWQNASVTPHGTSKNLSCLFTTMRTPDAITTCIVASNVCPISRHKNFNVHWCHFGTIVLIRFTICVHWPRAHCDHMIRPATLSLFICALPRHVFVPMGCWLRPRRRCRCYHSICISHYYGALSAQARALPWLMMLL